MLRKDRFWVSFDNTEQLALLIEKAVFELYEDGVPSIDGVIDYLESDEDDVLP